MGGEASVPGDTSKYHRHWVRWDGGAGTHAHLLDLVGFNKTVLEVGCSTGYLSRVMRQRGCQVTGVDIDAAAVELARPFCRRVIVGDIEHIDWPTALGDERFDVIMFGDVLEHTRSPEIVLRHLRDYLAPAGYIVASLPNIAHGDIRLSLLLGRFEYSPLGILDETHLRFFTRETAERMLASSGLQISQVRTVNEVVSADLVEEALGRFPQLRPEWVQAMLAQEDAQVFQYIFRAIPIHSDAPTPARRQATAAPTLSVIVAHQGDAAKLSRCLWALAAEDFAWRQMIIVAETEPEADVEWPRVKWQWQARPPDQGEMHALNQALASVDGDVALVLDSGSIPQTGAVSALTRRFAADESVGVVGLILVSADRRTVVQAGAYLSPPIALIAIRGAGRQVDDVTGLAQCETDFVSTAGMALRHSLWQSLEGFDESYLADYAAADFCARVWRAGSRVLVESDAVATSPLPPETRFDRRVAYHRDRLGFVRRHYGSGEWPKGFFEAEKSLGDETISTLERQAIRLAYLWHLPDGETRSADAAQTLLDLYRHRNFFQMAKQPMTLPRLQMHKFSSTVPLISGWVARLRAAWGSVAARWYAESLAQQQNAHNQAISDQINAVQVELTALGEIVARIGAELADLRSQSGRQTSLDDSDAR